MANPSFRFSHTNDCLGVTITRFTVEKEKEEKKEAEKTYRCRKSSASKNFSKENIVYVNRLLWRVSVNTQHLILKDKLEVLKRLDKGEGVTKLATEFNVGKASAGDINEWMEEDGETAEFLTDDDIAAAVTQEPMEEEGSDDETQCDKKREVVPHADGAAALALRYLEQQHDTTPADVLFMRRWRNYASSKDCLRCVRKNTVHILYLIFCCTIFHTKH
ncbi:hypothetical protein TNCV_4571001 [Trichonephila clavipes]|nr:hypothetical protein TNCV_4571001 [Trichonephila clavipes]